MNRIRRLLGRLGLWMCNRYPRQATMCEKAYERQINLLEKRLRCSVLHTFNYPDYEHGRTFRMMRYTSTERGWPHSKDVVIGITHWAGQPIGKMQRNETH